MINNDLGNKFLQQIANRAARKDTPADVVNRLKSRAHPKAEDAAIPADGAAAQDTNETKKKGQTAIQDILNTYTRGKGKGKANNNANPNDNARANANDNAAFKNGDGSKLSAEEKRQKELAEILAKIEEEEAQKQGGRGKDKTDGSKSSSTSASSSVSSTVETPADDGVEGFLNEMPLFNEFKTSLMEAFKSMDSGTSGSIRAQYELNYSTMQAVANAAGGFEYEETTVNIKFDLSYVKAANGGTSGADIAKALEGATDFASLMDALEQVSSDPAFGGTLKTGDAAAAGATPPEAADPEAAAKAAKDEFIKKLKEAATPDWSKMVPGLSNGNLAQSMKDYFSPEATAGRILDFATAFFPASEAFKEGGDTEEARKKFADMMGKAIQKGFDQAMGSLGTVPDATQKGIDKTHELVFKGLDDFVKNGMKEEKKDTYNALQDLAFNYEASVTRKKVSVSYGQPSQAAATPGINAEA